MSDSYLTSEREKEIDEASSIDIEINDEYAADTFEVNEEPVMEDPFNPAEINISSKQDTLRNVLERLRNGEIDMNTEFQRHAELWDTKKMSRLIESILIRFLYQLSISMRRTTINGSSSMGYKDFPR